MDMICIRLESNEKRSDKGKGVKKPKKTTERKQKLGLKQ